MTRRHPDDSESFADAGPLFAARARATDGMTRASVHAERVEPGWKDNALQTLCEYARTHSEFLIEHIRFAIPHGADRRAIGAVTREARKRGWIEHSGFAAAASSNGSPKCTWRSLIAANRS